jgi:hypothetical protein
MRIVLYFFSFVVLSCLSCRPGATQHIIYDCRVLESEFDASIYVKGSPIDSSYSHFLMSVENGAFFIQRYIQSKDFTYAILLKDINNQIVIANLMSRKEIEIRGTSNKNIDGALMSIEKGSFRQACFKGPTEGSISVLLVKNQGKIILKYEASQYDYSHLNENERAKIKNALVLIDLIINNSTVR